MNTTHTVIGEHDVVALLNPVEGWPIATTGTVVSDHPAHKLIEISNHLGEAIDFISVPPDQLRLIEKSRHPSP